ncbi:MAG TPA: ABC transporter permease subunit [Thermomicrobiales bacterium]|nr:ABC transporter permease subunit [Thermomicrobiales bacterium]
MIGSIAAETLLLSKRAATWVLFGIWVSLAAFFGFILPYITYRNEDPGTPGAVRASLTELLPHEFVGTVLGGFPFFGGVLILILGVMTLGSEYGWGTLKTLFTQRPGRLQIFAAKLVALGLWLVVFVLGSFLTGAIASAVIAMIEEAPVDWPGPWSVMRGLAAAWLILAVWSALGVLLGVVSRGTALAIGIGILYGLVIEGLINALFDQVSVLRPMIDVLLRANAYSLAAAVGASTEGARDNGPGSFGGPYVDGAQALAVLVLQLVAFVVIAGALLRRRDVT